MALLVRPIPYPEESPGGLLLRATEENGWQSPVQLLTAYRCIRNSDEKHLRTLFVRPEALEDIMHTLGMHEGIGVNLAYPRDGVTEVSPIRWSSVTTPWSSMRFVSGALCPFCLRKQLYLQRTWDHRLVTSCPKHGVLLIDRCPECGLHLSWNRPGIATCRCGYDLSLSAPETIDTDVTAFVKELATTGDQKVFAALDALFEGLLPILDKVGSLAEQHKLVELAVSGIRRPESLAPLVANYILDNECGGLSVHPRITCQPLLASRNTVVQEFGVLVLRELGIRGWLPASSLEEVSGQKGIREAAAVLGLTEDLTKKLVHHNILCGKRNKSGHAWRIENSSLNRLLMDLENRKSVVKDAISVFLYGKTPGPRHSLAEAISDIIAGALVSGGFDLASGLESLTVEAPARKVCAHWDDCVTVAELAERCNVHSENIRFAIKAGVIPAEKRVTNGRKMTVIDVSDAEKFEKDYIFAGSLARQIGASVTNFAEKLMSTGIRPVSGPKIDGGLTYIFLRQDLEALDLGAVAALDNYPTRTGRKKLGLAQHTTESTISLAKAAEALGLTVQRTKGLVLKGLLEAAEHGGRALQINRDSLDRLKSMLDDKNLIAIDDAAKIVGETRSAFEYRWVHTHLVTVIDLGVRRVIRRQCLEEVQRYKRIFITADEAGKLLGSHRSLLPNWERRGLIAPEKVMESNIVGVKLYRRTDFDRLRILKEYSGPSNEYE